MKQSLHHVPRAFNAGNWSGVRAFEALPKRQFVTESININKRDHHIWSTIKTLSATLPEPISMECGPGLLEPAPCQLRDLIKNVCR